MDSNIGKMVNISVTFTKNMNRGATTMVAHEDDSIDHDLLEKSSGGGWRFNLINYFYAITLENEGVEVV